MMRSVLLGLLALTIAAPAVAQEVGGDAHLERERTRIRMHLSHVERVLRARDVSHLTDAQREARARHLDTLHAYWVAGRFPINEQRPDEYLPIFIDEHETACAVGDLMIEDGAGEVAQQIHEDENYAYVPDIETDGVLAWAEGAGFTVDELAMIQPSYCGPFFDAAPCDGADAGPGGGDDDGGGCAARPGRTGSLAFLAVVGLAFVRRRRQ